MANRKGTMVSVSSAILLRVCRFFNVNALKFIYGLTHLVWLLKIFITDSSEFLCMTLSHQL